MSISFRVHGRTVVLGVLWITAIGLGLAELLRYGNQVGEPPSPPRAWPKASSLPRSSDGPTLAMFLHPQCPCSHAAIEELAIVRARTGGFFSINILFLANGPFETRSPLWYAARRIHGALIAEDPSGLEIKHFGVETSGHVLVFREDRSLINSGGITSARGHGGPNRGREALLAMAQDEPWEFAPPPALGCALHGRRQPDHDGGRP